MSSIQHIGGMPKPQRRESNGRQTGRSARQRRSRETLPQEEEEISQSFQQWKTRPQLPRRMMTKSKALILQEMRAMLTLAHQKLLELPRQLQLLSRTTTTTHQLNHSTPMDSVFLDFRQSIIIELLVHLRSNSPRMRSATALPSPRRTTPTTDMARLQPTQRNSTSTRIFANAMQRRTFPRILIKHLSRSTSCTQRWASRCQIHSTQMSRSMIGRHHSKKPTLLPSSKTHDLALNVLESFSVPPDLNGSLRQTKTLMSMLSIRCTCEDCSHRAVISKFHLRNQSSQKSLRSPKSLIRV